MHKSFKIVLILLLSIFVKTNFAANNTVEYLYDLDGNRTTLTEQTQNTYTSQKTYSSYHLIQFLHGLESYTSLAEKMSEGIDLSNEDITSLLDGYSALNAIEQNLGDCALQLLDFKSRSDILQHISEWSASDSREDLMVKVIENTPEAQYVELLDLLSADNCALTNAIWSDVWFSHLDRFIGVVSEIALYVKQSSPDYSGSDLPLIPFYNDGVFWDWDETEYDWSNCEIEFTHDYTLWEGEDYVLHPYDLVRIDVKEDFRFPIMGGNGRTLTEGQILIVPAIWAYYILDKQNDITNLSVLRAAIDAIIIIGSGGSAAPFYIYAASIDLIVTGFENSIMSNDEYQTLQELYPIYDALATVIGSMQGLGELKWFSKLNMANSFYRFGMRNSKLRSFLINAHTQIAKRDEVITLLRDAILKTTGNILVYTNAQKLKDLFVSALISMELTRNAPVITNAVIRNVQNDFVAIELLKPVNGKRAGEMLPFANVVKNEFSDFTYHLDDIKWYDNATDGDYGSVIELYDVKYKNQLDEIVDGNFEVVVLENGLVRVVELAEAKFSKSFINSIDGFSDDIASLVSSQGLSLNDFKLLQQKRYDLSEMSALEMIKIDAIRDAIPLPNGNTILQKAIPKADIQKYLDGTYNQIGGFVTTAKDAKHLLTFEDVFYGMRLDYNGTAFNLSDGSFGVIRYKTPTPNATVPKLPEVVDPAPFTGNGFTGGSNGKLGVPEWKTPYNTPVDGAELWEIASDGTETLKAVFDSSQNKFIAVP